MADLGRPGVPRQYLTEQWRSERESQEWKQVMFNNSRRPQSALANALRGGREISKKTGSYACDHQRSFEHIEQTEQIIFPFEILQDTNLGPGFRFLP